jgi:hypothetical protein
VPKTVEAAKLKERTLTNLYNQRPRWLADPLDRAGAAAHRWPADVPTDDALARLLALNWGAVSRATCRGLRLGSTAGN